jgi:ribonucleoside-triphosphate reductase
MTHKETQVFSKEVLNFMREKPSDYQEEYGDLYNLEATPAESTSYRLAKHDVRRFPDIVTASDPQKMEAPYYTNSSHLPVGYTDDIFEALDVQDELQTLYTSGTVFHGFLGEKLPNWQSAATLVRTIAENYKLPYYTLSPTYSVCRSHGYLAGEVYECPHCGSKTEVYSRITGYYRPVQNWNDGKSQEFKDRKVYAEGKLASKKPLYLNDTRSGEEEQTCECAGEDRTILFATASCPNCKMAAMFLDKAGISYEKLLAEDNKDLVAEFEIKQAPTLIHISGGKAEKVVNLSNIKAFCEKAATAK